MADNTLLNSGTGGDTVRDLDRLAGGIKTQVVQLDVGGVSANAESLVSLTNPLPQMVAATNFFFSAAGVNSSTVQLAASATFTGTIESIQSQQTVSLLLTSDQPGTLTLYEYIDLAGSFICNTIIEPIVAGVPFSEAYTANGNYFRLTFKNNGASTTTTLNINTAFGTLPAVTSLGNGQVALNEVNGVAFSLGQGAMTGSLPVVIASNQSVLNIQDLMTTTTYNVAGVIAINTVLMTVDCQSDAGVSIQCTSMGTTGVVTPSWSNDNVTWIAATNLVTQAGVPITTFASAGLWTAQVMARYFRLQLTTATTAGTTTIYAQALSQPMGALQAQTVVQPTAANLLVTANNATPANLTCTASIAAAQTLSTVTTVGTLSAITAGPAIASGLYSRVTDGTTLAGVTAASTAAVAATGGLVVSLSPNSPVPATAAASAALTSLNVNATGALVQVKATAGNLFGFSFFNGTAAVAYLSFWNLVSASVTLGTTAPICVFALPASGTLTVNPGMFGLMAQSTGLSFAAVTTYNGSTTASVTGSIYFK